MGKRRFRLKSGRSSLIIGGNRVKLKPGDVIECEDYELPEEFRNQFDEILPPGQKAPIEKDPDAWLPDNFELKHRGGGWFDVINKETNEPINDEPLRKTAAYALAGFSSAMEGSEPSELPE